MFNVCWWGRCYGYGISEMAMATCLWLLLFLCKGLSHMQQPGGCQEGIVDNSGSRDTRERLCRLQRPDDFQQPRSSLSSLLVNSGCMCWSLGSHSVPLVGWQLNVLVVVSECRLNALVALKIVPIWPVNDLCYLRAVKLEACAHSVVSRLKQKPVWYGVGRPGPRIRAVVWVRLIWQRGGLGMPVWPNTWTQSSGWSFLQRGLCFISQPRDAGSGWCCEDSFLAPVFFSFLALPTALPDPVWDNGGQTGPFC